MRSYWFDVWVTRLFVLGFVWMCIYCFVVGWVLDDWLAWLGLVA